MRLEFLITEYSKKHTNEKAVDYLGEPLETVIGYSADEVKALAAKADKIVLEPKKTKLYFTHRGTRYRLKLRHHNPLPTAASISHRIAQYFDEHTRGVGVVDVLSE